MKKNTKGAIAVGAAALLLAGGAGTMAAWSDEASLGGGSVESGQLRITETAAGSWTWADGTPFSPTDDRIVPGDSVQYTAEYTLVVEGDNLVASLTPDLGGVTGDLAPYLTVDATSDTTGITLDNITEANNGDTVSVTTTITFNPETSGTDGMETEASLEGSTITLQQTAPAPGTP
ncbi:MAG TPA: alternate-type signal peptide domain-containing protein [Candidatus Avipropionibacterium avicola]|uniref:Alternate-type signal peptide domain-containing protein n=1 Tax=Candidatus Avipropionibacterium avicola TaxID=2840701 RepID=A0A9D1KN30_9ACTN|nr:alternate-type signal peptide domain-containing protein [Candidatus Avipropionibacterium avicola]